MVTIALAGDTMLGRGVGSQIATAGPDELFSDEIREFFGRADLRLLNLECCVSDRGRPWHTPGKPFHFRGPPDAADVLADLGVDCVTLANNHALDFGYEALADTRAYLAKAGIRSVGAGIDLPEAREPVILEAGGARVAVLGVTDHPADFAASLDRPGVAYADLREGVPYWLTARVSALSAGNEVVLVMPHWGPNMTTEPLPYVRAAAAGLIGAGATLVAGHSAHVFQGVQNRVLYDLGDLIDDYIADDVLRNDLGLLFLVTVEDQTLTRIRAVPLSLEYARTRLATTQERAWIRERFTTACASLGTTVTEENGLLLAEPA